MSDLVIRRATPADLKATAVLGADIVRLHHATNPKRFFLPDQVETGYAWWLSEELARENAIVLVAERDGIILGFAYGTLEERDWAILVDSHGVIQDLCVAKEAQHSGIGRALVLALIAELEAKGAPRILLRAMVQNDPARKLFASLGFAPTMVEMTRERDSST